MKFLLILLYWRLCPRFVCALPTLNGRSGAGGTVSELISCHGINYGNDRTRHMLKLFKEEKNIGLQLFGEDASRGEGLGVQDLFQNLSISIWVAPLEKSSLKAVDPRY